jgi:hypothetical protein
MAKNDVRIVGTGGLDSVPTMKWQTEANSVAIYAGELVKLKSAGSPYALGFVDADITLGTDAQFLGLAKTAPTPLPSMEL